MTMRLSALLALAFVASVGLTACGDDDDRDDTQIQDQREGNDDDD
jgi:hypothetical protein